MINYKFIAAVGGAFVAGASSAVLVTAKYFKKKYNDICDKEIADVREAYSEYFEGEEKTEESEEAEEDPHLENPKEVKEKEEEIASNYGVDPYIYEIGESNPEIIDPEDFAVYDEYEVIELTYYVKDRILTDEMDERLDPVMVVGKHNLEPFHHKDSQGRLPDVIYIRDDGKEVYYEVDRCDEPYDGPEKEE